MILLNHSLANFRYSVTTGSTGAATYTRQILETGVVHYPKNQHFLPSVRLTFCGFTSLLHPDIRSLKFLLGTVKQRACYLSISRL